MLFLNLQYNTFPILILIDSLFSLRKNNYTKFTLIKKTRVVNVLNTNHIILQLAFLILLIEQSSKQYLSRVTMQDTIYFARTISIPSANDYT